DQAVADRAATVLASLAFDGQADHDYAIEPHAGGARLWFDGAIFDESASVDGALAMLMWHVNREAVASRPDLLLVHAAVAAWRGNGIVLPAAQESGKTTLVAGL